MKVGDLIGSATVSGGPGLDRMVTAPGTYTMTILGWRPRSLNELMGFHHMTVYKLKKRDKQRIALEKMVHGIPDAVHKRRVSLRIVLQGRDKATDPDANWKSLLDALVACRLLVNDSSEWVSLGEVEYERGKRATVLTLTDIET